MEQREIDHLIEQYLAAWNTSDPEARRKHLDQCWGEAAAYTDPLVHAPDRDALDAVIASFRKQNPEALFTLVSPAVHHHGHLRFYWQLDLSAGHTVDGMDYGEIGADRRLARIVGFF